MYWIYLVIFVIMVFVPDIILNDFLAIDETTVEELAIFFLGGLGFVLYLIKEKRLANEEEVKVKTQREASRMSKDLTSSYSFIGEINRKLEIFKNISLGIPAWFKMTSIKKKKAFEYIMDAIRILTKSDEYKLAFMDKHSCKELFELKSKKNIGIKLTKKHCLDGPKKYFETDTSIIVISPEDINGIIAVIIIKKKTEAYKFEDPEMLKAIASQALVLYILFEKTPS